MMRTPDTWIFVTGAPRSGTTFVGQVLSRPLAVDYIHEPFNPDCGMPGFGSPFPYTESGALSEPRVRDAFERIRRYDFELKTAYYRRDGRVRRAFKRIAGSRGPYHLRLARLNVFRRAALVKDPIGCLLADYAQRRFGFRTIILVRHPVAFCASFLRLDWDARPGLAALAAQPDFVEKFGLARDLDAALAQGADRALDAAALWRTLNRALFTMAASNAELMLVRHEDVSAAPLDLFARMHAHAGLPWTPTQQRFVDRQTRSGNRREAARDKVQDFRRDSAALLELRVGQIDRPTRVRIHECVRDVSAPMYDLDSFRI